MRGAVKCGSCVVYGSWRRCVRCLRPTCRDCKAPGSDAGARKGVHQPLVCKACAGGDVR